MCLSLFQSFSLFLYFLIICCCFGGGCNVLICRCLLFDFCLFFLFSGAFCFVVVGGHVGSCVRVFLSVFFFVFIIIWKYLKNFGNCWNVEPKHFSFPNFRSMSCSLLIGVIFISVSSVGRTA